MSKKRQSRATKIVLASLLAASLSAPTFAGAASANVEVPAINVLASDKVLADGEYEIVPEMTKRMNNHFQEPAKLIVKDGKMTVELVIKKESNSMVDSLQSERDGKLVEMDTVEGGQTTETRVVSFPVAALGKTINAHVIVNIPPQPSMPKGAIMPHDFEITVNAPGEIEEVVAETIGVKVYKDGEAEESIMKSYMSSTVEVTKEDGKNIAVITFKEANTIQSFKVEGKEATVVSENKEANERKYSFEVADLKKMANVDIHVVVNVSGVSYDSKHKVQLGFDVEGALRPNPFTDIDKDENKEAILNLYAKGIVKGQAKFNPRNDISRSQFALMVARALELKDAPNAGFKDLTKIKDEERLNAINALAEIGVVKKGEKFNPDNTLTRQQGALMLYRAVKYVAGQEVNMGDPSLPFYADGHKVTDEEAQKAFALLYTGGIMTGSPTADGKKLINAGSNMKRTHMAKILNGSLQYMDQK